jgi:hypothetical protein
VDAFCVASVSVGHFELGGRVALAVAIASLVYERASPCRASVDQRPELTAAVALLAIGK